MNHDLRAWLLEGEPLPEGVDPDMLLAGDPEAQLLQSELHAIDALAADLPDLAPPPHLDAAILALVETTPQDLPALADAPADTDEAAADAGSPPPSAPSLHRP